MSIIDGSKVSPIPYVSLTDASVQDHTGGRTFDFDATHNAAAAGVSLGIAWVHGTMQERGGPTPVKSWSTMEVIKSRATPRN